MHAPDFASAAASYFGALLAYGSLASYVRTLPEASVKAMLERCVLPLYAPWVAPAGGAKGGAAARNAKAAAEGNVVVAMLVANANWLLGEYASAMPSALLPSVFACLEAMLLVRGTEDVPWQPVRASAATALANLIQAEHVPPNLLSMLQAVVSLASLEDGGERALLLLSTAAQSLAPQLAPHIPALVASFVAGIAPKLPPPPTPWPAHIEAAVETVAQLVDAAEEAAEGEDDEGMDEDDEDEEEEDEDEAEVLAAALQKEAKRKLHQALVPPLASLLQHAWLAGSGDMALELPPPSCLPACSTIVAFIARQCKEDAALMGQHRVPALLERYTSLLREWPAWEEEEEDAALTAIDAILELQAEHPMANFLCGFVPPPPHAPVPEPSMAEGICAFLCACMESARVPSSAAAASRVHALLHAGTRVPAGSSGTSGDQPRETLWWGDQAIPLPPQCAVPLQAVLRQISASALNRLLSLEAPLGDRPLTWPLSVVLASACARDLPEVLLAAHSEGTSGLIRLGQWVVATHGSLVSQAEGVVELGKRASELKLLGARGDGGRVPAALRPRGAGGG
eukprot:jgi/Mesvir1/1373/Mv12284-RA.2